MLGAQIFTIVMPSPWIYPLIVTYCPSLSIVIFFILSDMRIVTQAFFCFPFAWNIFFHPLTFSLYVSLGLKWVSCKQHIYGSCFCVHSASLCHLVGAFSPLIFKIIIDIWEGGSGWGIHVNPWLIHVNVWQKPLQYCKVISLQLIKKIFLIKKK